MIIIIIIIIILIIIIIIIIIIIMIIIDHLVSQLWMKNIVHIFSAVECTTCPLRPVRGGRWGTSNDRY